MNESGGASGNSFPKRKLTSLPGSSKSSGLRKWRLGKTPSSPGSHDLPERSCLTNVAKSHPTLVTELSRFLTDSLFVWNIHPSVPPSPENIQLESKRSVCCRGSVISHQAEDQSVWLASLR